MSLRGHEGAPKTHVQELEEKIDQLSKELTQTRNDLSTARERAVKAEQERDTLKAKKPEADPETVKRLRTAEAENVELKRKAKEKDDLLLKAQGSLKKAVEDQEKLKAEAKAANERADGAEARATAAEKRAAEAEARVAVAEVKKPEVAASAPEAEKFDIRIDLLTTKERDEYFEKRSQWAADDRAKAEARKEYLRSLAEKTADRV